MCTREEIKSIVGGIVDSYEIRAIKNLADHEKREIKNHKDIEDKIDHAIIAIRSSIPGIELIKEMKEAQKRGEENQIRIEQKIDSLRIKITPVTDTLDVAKKVKKGTVWIAGFILAIAGIVESFIHIKKILK